MTTTVLGFDFGMKRIGVACGQSITQTAAPVTVLKARQGVPDWAQIQHLIDRWQPDALIVGLPLNMDGTEQPVTQAARRFGNRLQQHYKLPVEFVDERLSSRAAKWEIIDTPGKKKDLKRIDTYAACLIVETWLNQAT